MIGFKDVFKYYFLELMKKPLDESLLNRIRFTLKI